MSRRGWLALVVTLATWVSSGGVEFYDDIHGHDARLERELAKGYPFAP